MAKVRSPLNSVDDGDKQVCLGKRKNRSRKSDVDSEHYEGSKKGKSSHEHSMAINQSFMRNQDETFLTAKCELLEHSPLGLALQKIGIQIGVDTGTMLNKYIRKKSGKGESSLNKSGCSSGGHKSEREEKNSENSKKSK